MISLLKRLAIVLCFPVIVVGFFLSLVVMMLIQLPLMAGYWLVTGRCLDCEPAPFYYIEFIADLFGDVCDG